MTLRATTEHDAGVDLVAFEAWFESAEPALRSALVATLGAETGREAAVEALAYAWEHRDRVFAMDNPVGYLFRVGKRWGIRQQRRGRRRFGLIDSTAHPPGFEPALQSALAALSVRQRQVAVLCTGYGLTHAEAAEILGIRRSSVQNHAERGMARLRRELGT